MKSAAFVLALMLGGAAVAQYPSTTTTVPPADTATPAETGMPADTSLAPPPAAAAPATTTATAQIVQPGNSAPEHDARGIAVISDPATAPTGFNQAPSTGTGMGGPFADPSAAPATQPADQTYPPCTREVTDNCVQTYERGRSPQ